MSRAPVVPLRMCLLCAMLLLAAAGATRAQQLDVGTPPASEPVIEEEAAPPPAPAAPAEPDWVTQIKQPVPWFSWGSDERLRQVWIWRPFALSDDVPDNDFIFQRYRTRLWWTLSPTQWFDLNTRWTWESRYWFEPDPREGYQCNDAVWDSLNIRLKQPFGLPVTATIGRQDMILGDGWLVLEGTPQDGSRTIYFDAARVDVDLKDIHTTITGAFIYNKANPDHSWLPPFDRKGVLVGDQDEKGAILWVTNRSIKDTELGGYFIYKHNDRMLPASDDGDIYTFGARGVHDFNEHWRASGEGAIQFGNKNLRDVWAGGAKFELAYRFQDAWKNQLRGGYEFLSGDDPDTRTNEQFDPLWGRWPQWSELYIYTYATETRIAETTNLHRVYAGWLAEPTPKLQLTATYHLLFADENSLFGARPGFDGGNFRGQLFTAIARYKINRFLSTHLLGEFFCPGDFYSDDRNDPSGFLRAELVFTF